MSLFRCPLCQLPLTRDEKTYHCPNGHNFDIAAQGYTHLLPVNQKNSKMPGDDKGMAAARSAFLNKGYYQPLRQALCQLSVELTGDQVHVLDTGCGEGYYTSGIYHALLDAGKQVSMAGTDISKFILRRAAKREKQIEFAVASSYHLPLHDESIHLLINCFSPLALEEFRRVLVPGGRFLYVVPSPRHLWQMKEVLYEKPYLNEEKLTPYEGFRYLKVQSVRDTIHVVGQEDIHALFQMTPYYWNTPKAGCDRLAALEELDTEIAFDIHMFEKE